MQQEQLITQQYSVQLEALYDSRKGDNTKQEAIDAHIEIVKAKFPVDSKIYSINQLKQYQKNCRQILNGQTIRKVRHL